MSSIMRVTVKGSALRAWAGLKLAIPVFLVLGGTPLAQAADRGATDMPYTRYESENGSWGQGADLQTAPQFDQTKTASEASNQAYVNLPSGGSYVQWTLASAGSGVTLRFTLPDDGGGNGRSGTLTVQVNGESVKTVDLSSYHAWQYFPNGQADPTNHPGGRPRMRFDEVHFRLPHALKPGDTLRLQKSNGDSLDYGVDFVELEPVPAAQPRPSGYVSITDFGAQPDDGNADLDAMYAALAEAEQRGTGVYLPPGKFVFDDKLVLESSHIGIAGAGIWHTQIYFSNPGIFMGGILSRVTNVDIGGFSMNTINNRRMTDSHEYMIYKAFMGTYGNGSRIHDVWAEHFEVGAWIGGYDEPYPVDVTRNLVISRARFRNNYADGVNFAQGTSDSVVEQSSIRNEGDDALAMWPSNSPAVPEETRNSFRFNTIENNWRAGSVAIFGGRDHDVHNLLIKDCFSGSAMRFTNDFPGYRFNSAGQMHFYDITISGCGTSADLWGQKRGAIEFNVPAGVHNMLFENIDILDSQRHGVQLVGNGFDNITFNHLNIDGAGLDATQRSMPRDVYGGLGIMAQANSGSVVFNDVNIFNAEDQPYLNRNTNFGLQIHKGTVALSDLQLSPSTLALTSGQQGQLNLAFQPDQASNKNVTWTSSDPAVAAIANTDLFGGQIVGKAPGTATLSVRSDDGGLVRTAQVVVSAAPDGSGNGSDSGSGGSDNGGSDSGDSGGGNGDGGAHDGSCQAPGVAQTDTAPALDRFVRAQWSDATSGSVSHRVVGSGGDQGRWWAQATASGLYVRVDVNDTTRINDSGGNWWEDDTVELFIDGDNSKGSGYDGRNDFQLGFRWNDPVVHVGGNSVNRRSGIAFHMAATDFGYRLIATVPWSTLGVNPAQGQSIGLDIAIDDDDNGGGREAQTAAFATNDSAYRNPSVFGSVPLVRCGAGSGQDGDGSSDDGSGNNGSGDNGDDNGTGDNGTACTAQGLHLDGTAPSLASLVNAQWTNATGGTLSHHVIGNTGEQGQWWAQATAQALYVRVDVTDATRINDSGGNWWEDDTVELFLDGDNSKGSGYDGRNDLQLGFRWNDPVIHSGGNSVNRNNGIAFHMAATGNGYRLMAAIPWSTLGVSPAAGQFIGLDVAVDDDDNGGGRDSQITAFAPDDSGYRNPSVFGTLALVNCASSGDSDGSGNPGSGSGDDSSGGTGNTGGSDSGGDSGDNGGAGGSGGSTGGDSDTGGDDVSDSGGQDESGNNDGSHSGADDDALIPEGRGMDEPWVEYQAENSQTNAEILGPSRKKWDANHIEAEAIGRKAVRLDNNGDYVAFTTKEKANSIVVRFSIPDAPGGGGMDATLGLYVNGNRVNTLNLTSRYAWSYRGGLIGDPIVDVPAAQPHTFFDETRLLIDQVPAGAEIRLQRDAQDTAPFYVIDLIDLEQVAPPKDMPPGFTPVTNYGAMPDDGVDDADAIARAMKSTQKLWFPPGRFLAEKISNGNVGLDNPGIEVRGAGMWYTRIQGPKAIFFCYGASSKCVFGDFSVYGESKARAEESDGVQKAFAGPMGKNSLIENVWVEHVVGGIWIGNDPPYQDSPTDSLTIRNCRVRDTYADGIMLANGTHDSLVENCHMRNTGDDAAVVWSVNWPDWVREKTYAVGDDFIKDQAKNEPNQPVGHDNTYRNISVQMPWRANCFANYGGYGNQFIDSTCEDVLTYPGILIDNEFSPDPFGPEVTTFRDISLIRAGGTMFLENTGNPWHHGALKLYLREGDVNDILLEGIDIIEPTFAGIEFRGFGSQYVPPGEVFHPDILQAAENARFRNVTLRDITVKGAGTYGIEVLDDGGKGQVTFENVNVSGSALGALKRGNTPDSFFDRKQGNEGW